MKEKLIYLSLGILALVGILLTGVLIQRARSFEKQAAVTERQPELESLPAVKEASPAMIFKVTEATPSSQEATPSAEH